MRNSYLYLFHITFILSCTVLAIPFNLGSGSSLLLYNSSVPVQTHGIHCFRQSIHDLHPTREDCMKTIDQILAEPDLTKIKTWAVPNPPNLLREWKYGTCSIDLGIWSGVPPGIRPEDKFSAWSCVAKTQLIAQECLVHARIGGRSGIGPKGLFQLTMKHSSLTTRLPHTGPFSTGWYRP